jgi:hypothetical protein
MTRSLTKVLKPPNRKDPYEEYKKSLPLMSDENLEKESAGTNPDFSDLLVREIWSRYKNLKQKYEPDKCEHGGVEGDCAICLEEGKYG